MILMGANLLLGPLEGACPCKGFARLKIMSRAINNRHITSYYALNTEEDTKKNQNLLAKVRLIILRTCVNSLQVALSTNPFWSWCTLRGYWKSM
jgi:hypothetical protein